MFFRLFARSPLQCSLSSLGPQKELGVLCFISLLLTSYPAPGRPGLDRVWANPGGCRALGGCTHPAVPQLPCSACPLFFLFIYFLFFPALSPLC